MKRYIRKSLSKPRWSHMAGPSVFVIVSFLSQGCAKVPQTFSPSDRIPPAEFSHDLFHHALARHVHNGRVNYPQMAEDENFNAYLYLLQRIDPRQLPTSDHRLAFWINAYNAFAIKGILDGYSPATLTGRYTFFIGQEYRVGGKSLNLYDLEKHVLISDFQEPRIHFAIVCASQSCPVLQSRAYTPESLDQQLTASTRLFINDTTRNRFDRQKKIAYLSQIFEWFSDDFADHSGSLSAFVAQYVSDPGLANDMRRIPYHIEFLEYDWSLNGIPPSSRP